jgi:phosphatidylglycerol:prolipoprotein diacylglycerol transferase
MFPSLFRIGQFDMPTYGVLFSIAIMAGLWLSMRNCERQGVDWEKARNLGVIVVVSGVLGARVLAAITNASFNAVASGRSLGVNTLRAGGVYLGGLLCAIAIAFWYMHRKRMPVFITCDACAPGIALGHAIGRLGCFAAGCCWGKPTQSYWSVTFKDPIAHEWAGTPLGIPLVPTQVLESAAEFANFMFLMWLFRNSKFDGQVIGAYLFLYGLVRYALEYLRDDPGRGSFFAGAFSGMQLISILLVTAGVSLWLNRSRTSPRAVNSFVS